MKNSPSIIAETECILVIDKPAGLIVHSDGRTQEASVADWLLARCPDLAHVGEPWISPQGEIIARPGLVHRLDRTTSGIMIVAKTQELYMYLKNEFRARRIEKVYRAFVHGRLREDEGKIVAEIVRSSEAPRRWFGRACDESDRRAAITKWRVIQRLAAENGEPVTYLEARPKTGRTHQIRVHCAFMGHPLVADHLYAADHLSLLGFERPALHAYSISLMLPSGERATYTAALPDDFSIAVGRGA